jgi:hypothetical protein
MKTKITLLLLLAGSVLLAIKSRHLEVTPLVPEPLPFYRTANATVTNMIEIECTSADHPE